ncbi:MAG: hypothetical protein N2169_07345 [bacterium]|nr:hypothetical protein [bacterium]
MEQYDKIQQILFSENFEKTHESMNSDFMELFNISGKINEKLDSVKSVRNKKEKIDDNLNRIHENLEELIQLGFREFGISILEKEIDFKINNIKRMKQNILENLKDIIQEYTSLQELTAKYYDELENNYENVNRLLISLQVIKNSEQEIKEINNKIESLREDFRIISFLKDDFEGSGRKKDFLTFVFNVVFELISQKANSILGEITEGRYVIGFKDDIEILDNWYGMKRNVRSLSGGEKFLASLSIAMAISELMSTSKYKVKSMFIDEGFGTLDMDTLNDVVDYLENYFYNHSDKVLGIITHVEEIKDRFNYVIRVAKTKNGSEIQVINNI